MRMDEQLVLVDTVTTVNGVGIPVLTETKTTVWADKLSAKRAEYYAANSAGHPCGHRVQRERGRLHRTNRGGMEQREIQRCQVIRSRAGPRGTDLRVEVMRWTYAQRL